MSKRRAMKRFFTLLLAMAFVLSARAEGEQMLLRRVAEYVKALGSYDAEVDVAAGEYKASGSYSVAGDSYYIKVGEAEVYADGKTRYEVDHSRKEVSVDVVDLESQNILDNPTRCFDFVGEEYAAELVRESDGVATIRLVARDEDIEGEILLGVESATGKPLSIAYILYDDRVDVKIKSLTPRKTKLPTFSKGNYKGYDMVDFR